MRDEKWKERGAKALDHSVYMELNFKDDIERCVECTYEDRDLELNYAFYSGEDRTKMRLVPAGTLEAFWKYCEDKFETTAILNFADFKVPGGLFFEGSPAQEESVCHGTNLYNVLKRFEGTYYAKNKTMLNDNLYTNASLYSENVLVHEEGSDRSYCDVITCAAPYRKAAMNYRGVPSDVCSAVLEDRIKYLFAVINEYRPDCVILGAWGCGVFGNDPKEVATLFKKYLPYLGDMCVIFAIPDENSVNYKAFKEVFYGKL